MASQIDTVVHPTALIVAFICFFQLGFAIDARKSKESNIFANFPTSNFWMFFKEFWGISFNKWLLVTVPLEVAYFDFDSNFYLFEAVFPIFPTGVIALTAIANALITFTDKNRTQKDTWAFWSSIIFYLILIPFLFQYAIVKFMFHGQP